MRVYPNLKPRLMPEDIASLSPEQMRTELEKIVNHREKLIAVIEHLIEGDEELVAKNPINNADAAIEQDALELVRDFIMVETQLDPWLKDAETTKKLKNSLKKE